MANRTATHLPFVMDMLRRQPDMCETYENLQHAIDNPDALDEAINLGRSLGILIMNDDLLSLPFSYGASHVETSKQKSLEDTSRTYKARRQSRSRRGGRRRSGSRSGSRRRSRSRRQRSRSKRR